MSPTAGHSNTSQRSDTIPDNDDGSDKQVSLEPDIATRLGNLDTGSQEFAIHFVDQLLGAAVDRQASDIHLQPSETGLTVSWRVDGVLQPIGTYQCGTVADPVARLKVMSDLLTYKTEVPQEGRIRGRFDGIEMRVSSFPTLGGERVVVRLFAVDRARHDLDDLGFPPDVTRKLRQLLGETSGAVFITGPAGSGKTTTAYACLRQIVNDSAGGRSLCSLEDPVEMHVAGVAQAQTNEAAGFTFGVGLRSLLRQDPEVILVGEVRDPNTAQIACQAALTGQLVLSTFHAGSAAGAINRLSDMGIEPYLMRSSVVAVIGQRLVRRLCPCAMPSIDRASKLGLPVNRDRVSVGCAACHNTGYQGRLALVELMLPSLPGLATAILSRADTQELAQLCVQGGMVTCWQRALAAVESGHTSAAEVRRVMGFENDTN